ncbi:YifB family Mg chelatase-like AAA ATPase [Agromyces aerolatus]|uniref:YifB family Mg chelatase-like AAA ATPase n=1 Tax=Agromyces sp. LY-1074 TaxID=3074080 RepID=UPI0028678FB1|nr:MULTISPECIES: YifB family Mg chelatase-like AAA ATPase [unclassified Agromyces]MDR5699939.1 YifB family Mg chelatase-like AAA ATPase [Agromyces sp. LY-1074]MDR5706249.1 YifB family Mg chelatase-like AAA ATPase [Agromyces sp. LY-1358]
MPVGRTRSVALLGLAGSIVEVEADISSQLPAFVIVGLPDAALSQARDRVRSAATNAGCPLPQRRVTVNLSPASLPKQGSAFDLAIAVACLAAAGLVDATSAADVVHLGELGLDGRVRPVAGVLPAVLAASRAGHRRIMVPAANADEAALVTGVEVIAVGSLLEAALRHGGRFDEQGLERYTAAPIEAAGGDAMPGGCPVEPPRDLADVSGHRAIVESMLVAAAGGHHVFLEGPPGAGKTMLASRLPGILPELGTEEALEVASLRSLAGLPPARRLDLRPPFEAPHHTATAASMVGGGSRVIRPGAAPRATHGVLFLDEAPEFPAAVLDSLRQPLESGTVSIHRAGAVAVFPARFQLVLASNPCPCGAEPTECTCPPNARRRYQARLSGPLRDRVDVRMWVPRITTPPVAASGSGDEPARGAPAALTSELARARVAEARAAAASRLAGTPWRTNADMTGPWLRGAGGLHPGGRATESLDRALERGTITMRGYDRVLKVAWTVADLDGASAPTADHVARALFFRQGVPQ